MEAPGVAVVPWRPTSKWRNRNETLGETKSQRRWSWILTGHFGCFLKRTVQSLCACCMCVHIYTLIHLYFAVDEGICGCVCLSVCLIELHRASSSPVHMIGLCAAPWAFTPLSPCIISPAKVVDHHFPLLRWNSGRTVRVKQNIFTSRSLCGIKCWRAGWALLATFDHVKSWMH